MKKTSVNYEKGMEILAKIAPEHYQNIVNTLADSVAPDLGTLAVEFNYGQIFARPGLDLKSDYLRPLLD